MPRITVEDCLEHVTDPPHTHIAYLMARHRANILQSIQSPDESSEIESIQPGMIFRPMQPSSPSSLIGHSETLRTSFFSNSRRTFGFELPTPSIDDVLFVHSQHNSNRRQPVFYTQALPAEPAISNATKMEDIEFSEDRFTSEEETNYERYCCSIGLKIMTNPVYDPRAPQYPFEESAILRWLAIKQEHPFTRATLTPSGLIPNASLKQEIDDFVNAALESASSVNISNK